jgi:hypothetical protein
MQHNILQDTSDQAQHSTANTHQTHTLHLLILLGRNMMYKPALLLDWSAGADIN